MFDSRIFETRLKFMVQELIEDRIVHIKDKERSWEMYPDEERGASAGFIVTFAVTDYMACNEILNRNGQVQPLESGTLIMVRFHPNDRAYA